MHGVEEVGYVPVIGGREAAAAELVGLDVDVLPGGDEVPAGGDGGCEGRGEGGEEEENCGQPGGGVHGCGVASWGGEVWLWLTVLRRGGGPDVRGVVEEGDGGEEIKWEGPEVLWVSGSRGGVCRLIKCRCFTFPSLPLLIGCLWRSADRWGFVVYFRQGLHRLALHLGANFTEGRNQHDKRDHRTGFFPWEQVPEQVPAISGSAAVNSGWDAVYLSESAGPRISSLIPTPGGFSSQP